MRDLLQDFFDTIAEAKNAVKKGKAWAVIGFADDFTDALKGRSDLSVSASDFTIESILNSSEISVWLDQSSKCYHLYFLYNRR